MTTVANDNTPYKLLVEQPSTDVPTPASGKQNIYIDSTTHHLSRVDSTGGVTDVEAGSGGSVATDTIFDAKGDLPVGTGADTAQKLTVGSNGKVVTADSSQTTGLKYAYPGWTLLEQHTASGSASLDFTTGITSAFDDYVIEIVDLVVATDNVDLRIQYSSDGGSTWYTSSDYFSAGHYTQNGGSSSVQGGNGVGQFVLGAGVDNATSRPYQGTIYMRSFSSTDLCKIVYGNFAYSNQSFVVGGYLQGLLNVAGTAFNAFKIFASSGNLASGTVRLYGVAK